MTAAMPVWTDASQALLESVYDLLRTSRMNALYYGKRLQQLQMHSFCMELITAATASGSGLAAIATGGGSETQTGLLNTETGQWLWQVLALTAAAVAVIRPIYAPGKKIELFTRQQQGYHANYFALKKLAFAIRQEAAVTPDHQRRYDTFFDRHVQLSTEDEVAPKQRYLLEAWRGTQDELPANIFWWPPATSSGSLAGQSPPARLSLRSRRAAPSQASPPWLHGACGALTLVGIAMIAWLAWEVPPPPATQPAATFHGAGPGGPGQAAAV